MNIVKSNFLNSKPGLLCCLGLTLLVMLLGCGAVLLHAQTINERTLTSVKNHFTQSSLALNLDVDGSSQLHALGQAMQRQKSAEDLQLIVQAVEQAKADSQESWRRLNQLVDKATERGGFVALADAYRRYYRQRDEVLELVKARPIDETDAHVLADLRAATSGLTAAVQQFVRVQRGKINELSESQTTESNAWVAFAVVLFLLCGLLAVGLGFRITRPLLQQARGRPSGKTVHHQPVALERLGLAVLALKEHPAEDSRCDRIVAAVQSAAEHANAVALKAEQELARAGTLGKDFAPVAAELQRLAQRSNAAAAEIKALLGRGAASGEVSTSRAGAEPVSASCVAVTAATARAPSVQELQERGHK